MPGCTWDVFCRVVDNFGDIGFCWRLAKGLTQGENARVRLWVDDLQSFARIEPGLVPRLNEQMLQGVEIRRWKEALDEAQFTPLPEVVVQGFGCALPAAYLLAMAKGPVRPVWIDLEYLSAEPWIDEFHGRPSPHPVYPLVKHFFFPGFTRQSGGLLRERDLKTRRDTFQRDGAAIASWWGALGLAPPVAGERRLSLFCYPNRAALPLLQTLAGARGETWTVLIPQGVLTAELADFPGAADLAIGRPGRIGTLCLVMLPFLSQDDYDRLLWSSDVNFVRGEDSFVRAQWAGRPFIWQIYPQEGAVHMTKLQAFLDRYTAEWPESLTADFCSLWLDWNGADLDAGRSWDQWWQGRAGWDPLVSGWSESLLEQSDLVWRLAQFARDLLK
jgi:uncharacterized repeat protein (TIGR03837 family)